MSATMSLARASAMYCSGCCQALSVPEAIYVERYRFSFLNIRSGTARITAIITRQMPGT